MRKVTYPISIKKDGEIVMSLREDEVYYENGVLVYEVGDAFERKFWEMSDDELRWIHEDICKNAKPSRGLLVLAKTIEKILEQRRFIRDNQEFRNALLP